MTYAQKLSHYFPGAEWAINANDYDSLVWRSEGQKPTKSELDALAWPVTIIPDRVTARQFKLQLLADGLLDDVEAWVSTQDRAVQIAFEYSGTFARNEPMMQVGFQSLGFTEEQIDQFFLSASQI